MSVKIATQMIAYKRKSSGGLVGSLYRKAGKNQIKFIDDIRIPVFGHSEKVIHKTLQDLPAGAYFVQVSLPDGQKITRSFDVDDKENTEVLIDLPHKSPHEWSSLQALSGEFQRESLTAEKPKGRLSRVLNQSLWTEPTRYSALQKNPEEGYSLELLRPGESPADEFFKDGQALHRLSTLISQNINIQSASKALGSSQPIAHPSLDDDNIALFRFGHSGLLQGEDNPESFYVGEGSDLNRLYLIQKSRHGAQLICLPTPWMTPTGQASVELLVKTNSVRKQLDYSMTVGDPMINTALGYINSGAVHLAHKLIDANLAEEMLYQKVSYPFPATIGGYILVLGRNIKQYRSESNNWKSWVSNLDNWFDWLPDGAILHATMCLMDRNPDLDLARDALQRSMQRGLPIFTFGLKYLMDGLRYFVGHNEDWAQQCLQTLQPIAMRTDPGIPFLSVTYSRLWNHKKEPALAGGHHARHA
jgi:hypothetical protein